MILDGILETFFLFPIKSISGTDGCRINNNNTNVHFLTLLLVRECPHFYKTHSEIGKKKNHEKLSIPTQRKKERKKQCGKKLTGASE